MSICPTLRCVPLHFPLPSQPLFTAKDSPILDFYPKTFKVRLLGAVAQLPAQSAQAELLGTKSCSAAMSLPLTVWLPAD